MKKYDNSETDQKVSASFFVEIPKIISTSHELISYPAGLRIRIHFIRIRIRIQHFRLNTDP